MSKGSNFAVLSLVLAATTAPSLVEAKSYNGDGYRLRDRAMTSRRMKSSGDNIACLTSEARNVLARIRSQFNNVDIVSTCRPGATIAGTNHPSKHASGQAIDFRVPGRKAEVVRWLIANYRNGGIMTYYDMDHIHVDVGTRFVALNRPSGRT
ncbi:DUF882 domain-containing protein [Hyphomicrobium sp. 99]|uniref:YcbK family protein n=1 Tax=Hyphomicrobium sp. 99 TaxID=1163419 RepID=UPI0005F88571|nr:DUF882 domain-containing protein [Hyphomicrobium sp. 99]